MTYKLYHYYEKKIGPFKNLSKLSMDDATKISNQIKKKGAVFASQRNDDYLMIRRKLERKARDIFIKKGGKPINAFPHYMTLGACNWLQTWYMEPGIITIDWNEVSKQSMSFTYGDLFPTMRYPDEKPYRKQVYTKDEIVRVIDQFGLPQDWNSDGDKGPERYIEVQIWDEQIIQKYL
ncbi:hypothetical protein M3201_03270 [Paenibacillus motobuensis]|uniref:hypothetical protein n=1 Tax=Paenibacillus TaxID=44249 RepID=UPI00203B56F1|nr:MULTISPECIES: hypothetical protein [Paenibacillus]MCM3038722.1 hypothetical protein [Paenibacillus lutimineralis]MCM3645826.1 hypothetical protein [Paenibacillus motobuensis]